MRPARPGDAAHLPEIERRAAARFAAVGLDFLAAGEVTPAAAFEQAAAEGRLWVVEQHEGALVGFAMAKTLEHSFHLQEMDVLPEHGRRGLGRRLVERVLDAARRLGHRRVTLTTFREIPWNGPFYARLGFEEIEPAALSEDLRALLAKELEAGLVPELRCIMSYAV